jgi:hypothetical protein
MSREQRPFVSAVVWPFTVTVFGLLVLLALLAHWYDRLAVALEGQTTDFRENPAAVDAQEATKPDGRRYGGSQLEKARGGAEDLPGDDTR